MSDRETLLLAYADGELDVEKAREAERLLETDPRAREQLRIYRDTAAMLRAACAEPLYGDVPEKLVATVEREHPRSPVPRRQIFALAASLLLAVVGFAAGYGVGTRPPSPYEALIDEIAQYHPVYARDAAHLVEIPASRTGELEAWMSERIGRKLPVPDLSAAGFDFAGGRIVVVDGQSVAQLLYTRPGTLPLGVCVTALAAAPQPERIHRRDQVNLISWSDGRYAYIVVGEIPDDTLRTLAAHVTEKLGEGA
jgi:anti-sigma factor RsiW